MHGKFPPYALSPPLLRKRGREQTACASQLVLIFIAEASR